MVEGVGGEYLLMATVGRMLKGRVGLIGCLGKFPHGKQSVVWDRERHPSGQSVTLRSLSPWGTSQLQRNVIRMPTHVCRTQLHPMSTRSGQLSARQGTPNLGDFTEELDPDLSSHEHLAPCPAYPAPPVGVVSTRHQPWVTEIQPTAII